MKLYRLTIGTPYRWTGKANYHAGDATEECIVLAKDEEFARRVASEAAGSEGAAAWLDKDTAVEEIDMSTEQYLGKV